MSIEAVAVVLNHSQAGGTAKLVLIGIANHTGDGGAWPTVETLSRYANVDPRSVQRAITALVELGELSVTYNVGGTHATREDRRPNRYDVLVRCPADCDGSMQHRIGVTPVSPRDSDAVTPVSPRSSNGVTLVTPRGDASVANGVTPVSPEPSLEPSLEPSNRSSRRGREVAAVERPEIERLCKHLADRIEANGCNRPTVTAKWRDAARLMLDKDKRPENEIHAAIEWATNDEFWRANILSMPTLREKYERMRMQAARGRPGSKPSTTDARVADALALAEQFEREGL